MKKKILLILLIINYRVFAQSGPIIEVSAPGSGPNYGNVNITNNSEIGVTKAVEIDERNISGSPFWRNDWNKAVVFLQSGNAVGIKQAKLNLNTSEIYFLDSAGSVKAAAVNAVNKIVFLDKTDSLKTLAVFQKLNYNGMAFFQVLNAGNVQLLKSIKVELVKKDYDPALEKDNYSYNAKSIYYIVYNGNLSELNMLSKSQLVSIIGISKEDDTWLAANNNKLRKEKEIVDFLNFYNNKK